MVPVSSGCRWHTAESSAAGHGWRHWFRLEAGELIGSDRFILAKLQIAEEQEDRAQDSKHSKKCAENFVDIVE